MKKEKPLEENINNRYNNFIYDQYNNNQEKEFEEKNENDEMHNNKKQDFENYKLGFDKKYKLKEFYNNNNISGNNNTHTHHKKETDIKDYQEDINKLEGGLFLPNTIKENNAQFNNNSKLINDNNDNISSNISEKFSDNNNYGKINKNDIFNKNSSFKDRHMMLNEAKETLKVILKSNEMSNLNLNYENGYEHHFTDENKRKDNNVSGPSEHMDYNSKDFDILWKALENIEKKEKSNISVSSSSNSDNITEVASIIVTGRNISDQNESIKHNNNDTFIYKNHKPLPFSKQDKGKYNYPLSVDNDRDYPKFDEYVTIIKEDDSPKVNNGEDDKYTSSNYYNHNKYKKSNYDNQNNNSLNDENNVFVEEEQKDDDNLEELKRNLFNKINEINQESSNDEFYQHYDKEHINSSIPYYSTYKPPKNKLNFFDTPNKSKNLSKSSDNISYFNKNAKTLSYLNSSSSIDYSFKGICLFNDFIYLFTFIYINKS